MGRTNKFRGYRTHGRGKKAGRGAGKRGGRGKAGAFKHRRLWILKTYGPRYRGKHGFKRPACLVKRVKTINVGQLENMVKMKGSPPYTINLKDMNFEKLLGKGEVHHPLKVIIRSATRRAVKKIEDAGGEVETDA